jgi:hypothetical protein
VPVSCGNGSLPLPTRSTIVQRSRVALCFPTSTRLAPGDAARSPGQIDKMARLRFLESVRPSEAAKETTPEPAVSQLPKRDPSLRTVFTRWMPAASSPSGRLLRCGPLSVEADHKLNDSDESVTPAVLRRPGRRRSRYQVPLDYGQECGDRIAIHRCVGYGNGYPVAAFPCRRISILSHDSPPLSMRLSARKLSMVGACFVSTGDQNSFRRSSL